MKKIAVLFCVALFGSACSGSSSAQAEEQIVIEGDESSDDNSRTESSGDDEALALEFAACMRENGVEMDDPIVNADGSIDLFAGQGQGGGEGDQQTNREERQTGFEECGEIIEGASFAPGQDQADAIERQDSQLQIAQCLRENGYPDVEDPVFDDFGAAGDSEEETDAAPDPGRGSPFGDGIDLQDEQARETIETCRTDLGIEDGENRLGGGNRGGDNQGADNQGGDNQGGDNQGGDNQGADNQGGQNSEDTNS